jgi:sulfatase modifying factor 1
VRQFYCPPTKWRKAFLLGLFFSLGVQSLNSTSIADTFGSGANSFEIEFVTIGNPGNSADTTGRPDPAGSVPYSYRIGKYEVSEQMIDKANALGGLGITKDARGPDKPATGVSWFEAAKFVNWLNLSTGNAPAYKFDGAGTFQLWLPSDAGYNANNQFRNVLTKYFLPSVNEWYKAAYYDPAAGVYYDYPTGSDLPPVSVVSGAMSNTAVYQQLGPADISQAGGLSPYGSMAQGGNIWEWNETDFNVGATRVPDVSGRGVRGGAWSHFSYEMLSLAIWGAPIPSTEALSFGYRVASVIPEPRTAALVRSSLLISLLRRRFVTMSSSAY